MANYGKNKIPMVAPKDIAQAVAEKLMKTEHTKKVRYVVSDEKTGQEIAHILGKAIGKPDLKWQIISDQEMENSLKQSGKPPNIDTKLTELYKAIRSGKMEEDFKKYEHNLSGKIRLEEFTKNFAAAFKKA